MDTREDAGPAEQGPSGATWWPSGFIENFQSVSLGSHGGASPSKELKINLAEDELSSHKASQILWTTGTLSGSIPNGFYSVIPDNKLKEHFHNIPSPDDLYAMGMEGLRADIILVDSEKDKKLSMLKQLIAVLVRGLNSNPAAMIKKIAGVVSDVYKRPNSELSPAKATVEEMSHVSENRGVQLLGQIRHGSCRPRAILFKVLADTVGLESRLMVGLPNDGAVESADSYKHMSVIVFLNSVELLVDLMRFPGQLIPCSTKAIWMSHISAAGESDSAENDSCDSPLEPNSPLYGFSDRVDAESAEQDESLQPLFQRRLEASLNVAGPSLRNIMLRPTTSIEGKLSLSHSEPNIANTFWRRSRKKVIAEQRTASSSPEHPLFRARGRSMLSGDRQSFREYSDDMASSRSEGASTSETRRIRRRSISITPEIGDDIVRAVRAMNETLKQNRLLREPADDGSVTNDKSNCSDPQQNGSLLILLPNKWYTIFARVNIIFILAKLFISIYLDSGFFGEVFRGIWNGTDVAIKIFLEQDLTAENMEDFCNEISILSRLRHPNVILFLGACTKPPHLSMVTEYMEFGSLYYLIHMSGQKKKLSWRRRLKMLRDICRGLMCIHRMKIVHRDLKSANCLVNKHWQVKVCDFGLSRIMIENPMGDSSSAGTPEWMAPELIRNEPFTEKCDVFSLGVIMWELCTLSRPWEGVPAMQVVYAVANEGSRLEIPEGPLGKLIADCWVEPDERPSCEEILTRLLDCEYSLC
ncbi:serine/threonine-protein kinase EDR1-like [Macadamia integrifolia]|uniref:serine/threonine-protein kinase EDR1-like n=1 Tax=Macadamia integrifolia TaxID=60698 RepID=UPI001C5280B3|nr:serine/threonine-protein kinase EDR1-like [Macadamia integrifolia]